MSGTPSAAASLNKNQRIKNIITEQAVESIQQQIATASASTQVRPTTTGDLSSQVSVPISISGSDRPITSGFAGLFTTPGSSILGIPSINRPSFIESLPIIVPPIQADTSGESELDSDDIDPIEVLVDRPDNSGNTSGDIQTQNSVSPDPIKETISSSSSSDIEDHIPEGGSDQEEDLTDQSDPPIPEEELYQPAVIEDPIHIEMAHQMEPILRFTPNEIDTYALRRYAFPGARLSGDMITRYIQIPYFTINQDDNRVTRGIVLNMYARGRCSLERWTVNECQRTLAALEGIAPNLPNSCFAATPKARQLFVLSALHYLSKNGPSSSYHRFENWPRVMIDRPAEQAAAINAILGRLTEDNINGLAAAFNPNARMILGLPAGNDDILPGTVSAIMAEALAMYLEILAKSPTASALALSTEIYCLAYIGIAKQGNITDAKLTAICNAVSEETGRVINLTTEDIRMFSNSFKPFITANNAAAICEGLNQRMNTFSLRLCITMQQAVRSGMTSYWAVWEAISSYGGFPWITAATFIPQDFSRYLEAVNVVGNNAYYGFNNDLGVAKHTNYLSLSWLACKVLIKCDPPGYSALARYRGLPAHPRKEEQLQQLIDGYDPTEAEANIAAAGRALDAIRARITEALAANN